MISHLYNFTFVYKIHQGMPQCILLGYIKVHFTYPIYLMYWVMVSKGIFFASPLTSHHTSVKVVEGNYISHKTYCTLLHIVNISMVVAERGERTSDCLVVSSRY